MCRSHVSRTDGLAKSKSEPSVTMCPGGLIVHLNGRSAACRDDDEPDGCTGIGGYRGCRRTQGDGVAT